ncbi:ATP-dependent RecD-like DNA helicase [Lacrimispora saccharolytica]|uniref:SF1B family DNA helicase RecD2 n=1 Tax=Lacrimispora saccharolytica TaxID=84030 RepID=UPI00265D2F9C|nr:ATP-dependent RecD-like DNA helicase [Lacrimispora saccharolytica]MCF2657261.1 ATP-dependent RecD-like DNA helicase [Lacrimispora saccharolytica]
MEVIKGYVDHFLYYNESNTYGVLELDTEDDDVICTGRFPGLTEGETIEVSGEWVDHPTYGVQLKVLNYEIIEPTDILDMERYLASGAIKGIGPSTAKKIIKHFGEDTFRIIEEEPERLSEIKGITERKAISIATQMSERHELRNVVMFMQKYGISNSMAIKLYDEYGSQIKSIILNNPYKLAREVNGIGFKRADEIAAKTGVKLDSEFRIQCGIIHCLKEASTDGHTYLPREELIRSAYELLGVCESDIERQLDELKIERQLIEVKSEDRLNIYLTEYYQIEKNCAVKLLTLTRYSDRISASELDSEIKSIESELDIELHDLQREAVIKALSEGLFILTGGPGTGKTTTIKSIISGLERRNLRFVLAAPTGRAAKRMSETTGYEASTIHRLLSIKHNPEERADAYFEMNEDNPLDVDAVIIDEASMVDILLFNSLLKAITPGCKLIIVGDSNQLPSVGPGQVLKDMLDSGVCPNVELKYIFRQSNESHIVTYAHMINNGEQIDFTTKYEDFFLLKRDNYEEIRQALLYLICEKLPKHFNTSPMQIQVLTPMKKGALGVWELNRILQECINPPSDKKVELEYGENIFRVGDKVMQTKNNYDMEWDIMSTYGISAQRGKGVFNGDIGIIDHINKPSRLIKITFDDGREAEYSYETLEELELAYAITIHKSQGSEYPVVIMPLLGGPRSLLYRNLLYTGVTRAKDCVVILGSENTVKEMIRCENENRRYTGLAARIGEVEGI